MGRVIAAAVQSNGMIRGTGEVLKRLRRNSFPNPTLTSAAKAETQNTPVIAALKRCATQNREQDEVEQDRVLPQAAT
jgi:hypothetical protein